ncbi:MAG: FtsX-like permease family protein [Sphaerochaetaceae bacterium]
MKLSFILALRYSFSRTRHQRGAAWMTIAGLCVALMALVLVIGVMNGLQSSQLRTARNLKSFDLIIQGEGLDEQDFRLIKGVDKAYEFCSAGAMIASSSQSLSLDVRAFKDESYFEDPRVMEDLVLAYRESDELFALSQSIAYKSLRLNLGSQVSLTVLRAGAKMTLVPYTMSLEYSSAFASSSADFNSTAAFMDWERLRPLTDQGTSSIGIFLEKDKDQESVIQSVRQAYPEARITPWQEANALVYSAMMLEKSITFIFLLFILLIIALSLKKSTARLIEAKRKETAIMLAFGLRKSQCIMAYVISGSIIAFIGTSLGLGISLLLVRNMDAVFAVIDAVISAFTGNGSIFGYYSFNILLKAGEVALAVLVVFSSSVIFTALGAVKALKPSLMEVLDE